MYALHHEGFGRRLEVSMAFGGRASFSSSTVFC
jgi:hypothetical protein